MCSLSTWQGFQLQQYPCGVLDARQACRAQDAPLPLFDQVQAEHVVPGITALVAQLNAEIDALEQRVVPSWEGLVEPLERISDRMDRAWGTVSHLKASRPLLLGERRQAWKRTCLANVGAASCLCTLCTASQQRPIPLCVLRAQPVLCQAIHVAETIAGGRCSVAVEQQPGAAKIRRKSNGAEQRAVCCASARQGQQSAGREQSRGFSYAREQAVKDSEALRKAVEEVQPLKVQLALRLSQSRPLCGPGPPRAAPWLAWLRPAVVVAAGPRSLQPGIVSAS